MRQRGKRRADYAGKMRKKCGWPWSQPARIASPPHRYHPQMRNERLGTRPRLPGVFSMQPHFRKLPKSSRLRKFTCGRIARGHLALVPVRTSKVAKLHERLSVSPSACRGRSGHFCQLCALQPPRTQHKQSRSFHTLPPYYFPPRPYFPTRYSTGLPIVAVGRTGSPSYKHLCGST